MTQKLYRSQSTEVYEGWLDDPKMVLFSNNIYFYVWPSFSGIPYLSLLVCLRKPKMIWKLHQKYFYFFHSASLHKAFVWHPPTYLLAKAYFSNIFTALWNLAISLHIFRPSAQEEIAFYSRFIIAITFIWLTLPQKILPSE